MTATITELRAPTRGPLYPQTFGGFPACAACYQRTSDLTTTTNLRTGDLALLCRACDIAITTGRPVALPAGEGLTDTWEWLARSYVNDRFDGGDQELGVTETVIDQAITTLAPRLDLTRGWAAFEQLYEALLDLQEIREDNADPRAWECGLELAEELALDDCTDALTKLTGPGR
jgi:hypothetical protein